MHKNYLFDLDGTLLKMDTNKFVDLYMKSFCKCLESRTGIDSATLSDAIWKGTGAMLRNDGMRLNSDVFREVASKVCGKDVRLIEDDFKYYYENDFRYAAQSTSEQPYAKKWVELIKDSGGKMIIATNPVFPKEATYQRIRWAGLSPEDFDHITVYDNSSWCKPNLNYYEEICSLCGILPEESIMIGNDVDEDMCAAHLGFDVFLVTDCMINRHGKDISFIRHGTAEDFYNYLALDIK